jgi:DNA-binding transcriptional MocR family regulator
VKAPGVLGFPEREQIRYLSDLTDTLKISRREAEEVIALLAAQGYVKSANKCDAEPGRRPQLHRQG